MSVYKFTIKEFQSPMQKKQKNKLKRKMWGKGLPKLGLPSKQKTVGVLEKISKSINPSEKTS